MILRAEKNDLPVPSKTAPELGLKDKEVALGDALLSIISWAVGENIDPESALRKAALRYRDTVKEAR